MKNLLSLAVLSLASVGCSGAVGPMGPAGDNGEQGLPGLNGSDGVDGLSGRNGNQGLTGLRGDQGTRGLAGVDGTDALDLVNTIAAVARQTDSILLVFCNDEVVSVSGSGTKTTTGSFITAQHVTEGMTNCEMYSENLDLLGTMTSLVQDGERDQATLQVDWNEAGLEIPGIEPQFDAQVANGEVQIVAGHPSLGLLGLAVETQFTVGFVTAERLTTTFELLDTIRAGAQPEEDAPAAALVSKNIVWEGAWATDAIAWHGNSGGPVFDGEGQWVGLLVGGSNGADINTGPDLSIVIPMH